MPSGASHPTVGTYTVQCLLTLVFNSVIVLSGMDADPHPFNVDPAIDPSFHFNADPDPTSYFNADQDPDSSSK